MPKEAASNLLTPSTYDHTVDWATPTAPANCNWGIVFFPRFHFKGLSGGCLHITHEVHRSMNCSENQGYRLVVFFPVFFNVLQ